jgi:type I restriction enzyme S subunit
MMDQENGLPDEWAYATLSDICNINMGQSPSSEYYNTHKEGLPFFQGKAEFGYFYPTAVKWCTNPIKVAEKDDILISVRAPVGTTNLALEKCCIGRGLSAIRPLLDFPTKYFFYYLRFIEPEIEALGTGTTFKSISSSTLRTLSFPLAPLPEQHRIVAEIEKQLSRLDEAVAGLKRIQINLKRYRASVLKSAVEGKLTAEWRKQHPDTEPAEQLLQRILKERRAHWEQAELEKMQAAGKPPKDDKWKQKYKEPIAVDVSDLPALPEEWVFVGIEQLILFNKDAIRTGPFGSLLKKYEHQSQGIPVLGIENIAAMRFLHGSKIYITKEKADQLLNYAVHAGDILISRSGTVGEICVVPENLGEARISTNLMKITFTKDGMLPVFFTFLFNGSPFVLKQISEYCKGSTRSFLNQEILKKLVFVFPPLQEQTQIVSEVERRLSIADEVEQQINTNLKRAERLRQAILKKAFSGRLVPQDPDDEPASVLLEKIKQAQRA